MGRGDTICLTSWHACEEQVHCSLLHRVGIILLKTVFAVGVIAQTSLGSEVSAEEHGAIFGLALYASRVVCAVVGTHHKGFAQIVFCASKDVEVVFIGFGVGKHAGNRTFFGLGVACFHIV